MKEDSTDSISALRAFDVTGEKNSVRRDSRAKRLEVAVEEAEAEEEGHGDVMRRRLRRESSSLFLFRSCTSLY